MYSVFVLYDYTYKPEINIVFVEEHNAIKNNQS